MLKVIGALFVCMWIADFTTGFFHWMEDTYCVEGLPIVGSFICEPNIQHHIDPQDIVRDGTFFSRNYLQWVLCGGIFAALWLVGLGNFYTFVTLFFTSFGNEVHRWNHMAKTGPIVTFLKETGLIQIQKQHSLHHKPPYAQYYCTLSSLVNPVLERVNFWRRLEGVIKATTGIAPKRENRRDAAKPKGCPIAKPDSITKPCVTKNPAACPAPKIGKQKKTGTQKKTCAGCQHRLAAAAV